MQRAGPGPALSRFPASYDWICKEDGAGANIAIPSLRRKVMSDDNNSSIGWFLAGLGLGAVVGILYAPKSGRETRETLLQSAEEGRDYLVSRGREAREQVKDYVDRGRDVVGKQRDSINSAIEAGRSAYREVTEKK
jgi:gas vesicle protein